ncbi:MAG: multiheme c-type cytochrome [Isosphaerales bacterium]
MSRIDFRPAVSAALLVAVLAYVGCTKNTPVSPSGRSSPPSAPLANFGNPAAVLIVSGEQEGYMEPCGCSKEQIGGLIRRYDFVERLHNQKWPTVLIELGTLIKDPAGARGGFEQSKYKFDYSLKALTLLDYDAVALSAQDLKVGVGEALGLFDNNLDGKKSKIVVANVKPEATYEKMFRTSIVAAAGPVKLGITAVIDPETLQKLADSDKDVLLPSIKRPDEVLPGVLAELATKSDYQVLMVQGSPALARRLALAYPAFDVVVATSLAADPFNHEPDLLNGGKTMLVSIGKKGKYVGVIGFYPNEPDRMRYQLVTLNGKYDGPGAPMKHLIQDEYRGFLKTARVVETFARQNYFNGAPGAVFVGALTCKECHPKTFEFWSGTNHAEAFNSLLEDPKPNTAFDAECITCHTTGFEYHSGWRSETDTPHLAGNQCENCHGPASRHVADPDNTEFRKRITVTAKQADKNQLCNHCHDEDNSRDFDFREYWDQISHKSLDKYTDPRVHRGITPKTAPARSKSSAP